MKAILVYFDSLNRHFLPPYGGNAIAPNFKRLAERTAVFDTAYIGSMACMPARRELHNGRHSFLHRGWGPLEPFDDSMPQMLRDSGVYTHLITDHQHYWEEGGANYHTKYSTCELVRGQEGDPWQASVRDPQLPDRVAPRKDRMERLDAVNRKAMPEAHLQPMSRTFSHAREFIEDNVDADNWFLQVETFDPHEPFFTHRRYKDLYAEHYRNYQGRAFDWPPYRRVEESEEEVAHAAAEYAALVSMCDEKLGDILDLMDKHNMWDDTLLLVSTDHGFLLGEHDSWAKCWMPFYEEIARIPCFIWDPRSKVAGQRRQSLVQPAIDFPVTLLNFFGTEPTERMTGSDLQATVADDTPVRETGIFGLFGRHVNITDGRYVYMRGIPDGKENQPLYTYTLMPSNMRQPFKTELFQQPLQSRTFDFTRGCHVMQLTAEQKMSGGETFGNELDTRLYDLQVDPQQTHPVSDPDVEQRLIAALKGHMQKNDAPPEQYQRLGLE